MIIYAKLRNEIFCCHSVSLGGFYIIFLSLILTIYALPLLDIFQKRSIILMWSYHRPIKKFTDAKT